MPKNHRNYQKTRHIALSGLLFALAMALSFIEGTLVIPGLLPGMKLGLANIVVMYALFFMGARQALVLDVLKALFVFLVSGFTAGFLSLCGGLLSLVVMWVLYYLLPVRPTWFILSVCGALAHNVGQLLGAGVIISSSLSLYYAPVMLVLGLVMGALTSVTLRALLPALGPIDMALVGEPTRMRAAVGERGLVVLDCTAHGRAGHAARDEGINALYIAADDIAWLRGYRFERCSPLLGPIRMTATQIEAGTQHNVVPAECRFVVDVRTTDAYTNEETVEIVRRHMRSEAVPRSTRIRASAVAPEHPLVGAAAALGVERFVSPTTSDMALMAFPSLKMGAGDSARSHTADEYVLRSEVEQGVEGYRRYIAELAKRYCRWRKYGTRVSNPTR